MGIGSLLTHRANLVRRVALIDTDGHAVLDEDGHAQRTELTIPDIAVAIQPLSTRERAAQHQAGATVATHRIYAVDRSISTADFIEHVPDACPTPTAQDLPYGRYELHATQDAAGLGHHLEIDATLIGPALAVAAAGGATGSGSGS
jgi:hypothetical protein